MLSLETHRLSTMPSSHLYSHGLCSSLASPHFSSSRWDLFSLWDPSMSSPLSSRSLLVSFWLPSLVYTAATTRFVALIAVLNNNANFLIQGYIRSNSLTNGSDDMTKRCRELQASTAFYWFLFASFAASIVMTFLHSGSSMRSRGGMRRGGPSMSQV